MNLFAYCGDNPVHYSDASGNASESCYDDGFDIDGPYVDACGGGSGGGVSYTYSASVLNDIFPTGINSGYNTHIGAESYSSLSSMTRNMLVSCDYAYDSIGAAGWSGSAVCFAEGTIVSTAEGPVAIESIGVGDLVWASDPESGVTELKKVVRLFRNETDEWIHLTVNGEEIVCTPGHPFYSPVRGWTAACHLRAGDILVTLNGDYVVLEKVQHELLESPAITYNFEVEDFHTYYVGSTEVLVHNECTPSNSRNYSPKMIAEKYNITVEQYHKQVKPDILNRVHPNEYRVGRNPNIMLTKVGEIGYQGANKRGFQDTGLIITEVIRDLGLD